MSRKPRADSALKTLPLEAQEALFALLRKTSYEKALPIVAKEFGVRTSSGALSQFFSWYPLSRRLEQAKSFADTITAQIKANPALNLDAEKVSAVGQIAFEAQALAEQDPKLFVALRRLRVSEKTFELEEEKFRETMKSSVEKGLDALQQEIKGNAEALALFERLKASVLKSMEGTK
jgi:hypothetical protein